MSSTLRRILLSYGAALAASAGIAAIMKLGGESLQKAPSLPFIVSVIIAAWYGGMGPGILAAASAVYLINQFFSKPEEMDFDRLDLLRSLVFTSVALAVSWLRDARVRAESALQVRERQQAAVSTLGQQALAGAGIEALMEHATTLVSQNLGGASTRVTALQTETGGESSQLVAGRSSQATIALNQNTGDFPSSLVMPIRVAGLAWGHLTAEKVQRREGLANEDIHFLQAIANVLSTALDQRRAERAMRESEARTRAILSTAPDGIITVDDQGVIESVNPAAEKLFGYPAAELVGLQADLLLAEPFHNHFPAFLRLAHRHSAQRNGNGNGHPSASALLAVPAAREMIGRRKGGHLFTMDLAISLVHLADRTLLTGIARDTTERRQLEQEILAISDRERRRIGQDLHDGLGQHLTGISFMSSALRQKLAGKQLDEANDADKIDELVNQAIVQTRALARGLYPVELQRGLGAALQDLAANVSQVYKVTCQCDCELEMQLPEAAAAHVYRIAQEAVNNALKHGRASQVGISINHSHSESDADAQVTLRVEDNGGGFSQLPDTHLGMGLRIMEYRSRMIGGTLRVQRGAVRGTVVSVSLPAQERPMLS